MNFSERLIFSRKKRKLTQKKLAFITGLKASAISHFEKGRRRPSFKNLILLADGLCISIDYLSGRTDDFYCAGEWFVKLINKIDKLTLTDRKFLADFIDIVNK